MTIAPTPTEISKGQSDNTNNATKNTREIFFKVRGQMLRSHTKHSYAPGSNDRGHVVFVLSVRLFVCLFVCLLSTFTFAITFEL